MDEKKIRAMISLLDDQDERIYQQIHSDLLKKGEKIIPLLQNQWEESKDPLQQSRIEDILHTIHFKQFLNALKKWIVTESDDLLKGLLIINRYQYPNMDEQIIINQIESIKREIWLQMIYKMSPIETIRLINHQLYYVSEFTANIKRYYDPENSYISQVLLNKTGNPVLLASIYCIIAQKLDLPVYGINLPKHFILAYTDDYQTNPQENEVLFYINPFNKGQIFGRHDVLTFLKEINVKPSKEYYQPCSTTDIIIRVIQNLISSYVKREEDDKVEELNKALNLFELHESKPH